MEELPKLFSNNPFPQVPNARRQPSSERVQTLLRICGVLVLTLAAYLPALRCGFIWDDDDYVTQNLTLRDTAGLRRIWFEVGATPQYYPLVHTTFWLEYHAWK